MYWGLHGASSYVQRPPSERARMSLPAGQPQQNWEIWRILTAGEPYSQRLHFQLSPSAPLTDYLSMTWGPLGFLASPALLCILDEVGANTAHYPATLISVDDGSVLSEDYTYCVPPTLAAADRHRSTYSRDELAGSCGFIELVVAPSIEQQAPPMFVLAGYPRMLIHEHLRQRLQDESIAGWQAFPLDVISDMTIVGPLKVEIERRLQQHPTNGRLLARLAHLLHGLGHIERAIAAYERAITLIDYSAGIWGNIGELYAEAGRWSEAKRAYERGLRLMATPPSWYWGDYSAVLLALDEDDAAMYAAQQGMQAAQYGKQSMIATGMPWYRLGRVLQKQGDSVGAIRLFQEAIAHDYLEVEKLDLALGHELEVVGRLNEALDVYEHGYRRLRKNFRLLSEAKRVAGQVGDDEKRAMIEAEWQQQQTLITNQLVKFDTSFIEEDE